MNVKIEGKEYTLFIDYDRANLVSLSNKGKIKYFDLRVKKILLNPLKIMTKKRVFIELEPKDGSSVAWLCIVSLMCAGIEATAGFYKGDASRQSFLDFIYKYMNSDFKNNKFNGKTYGQCIRDYFRNGLSHGFCIKQGGVEHFPKYFEVNKYDLQMNPRYFLKDFQQAFVNYVKDLRSETPTSVTVKNFIKRFDNVFIKGQ